jgi:hypothetical protein
MTFEKGIENVILKDRYIKSNISDYDKKYSLGIALLFKFLNGCQAKE